MMTVKARMHQMNNLENQLYSTKRLLVSSFIFKSTANTSLCISIQVQTTAVLNTQSHKHIILTAVVGFG